MKTCRECGRPQVKAKGLCNACYMRDWRVARDGVAGQRLVERDQPLKMCTNCGLEAVTTRGRCSVCYSYFKRLKRERPARLWGRKKCGKCRRVFDVTPQTGLCRGCGDYYDRHGQPPAGARCECGGVVKYHISVRLGLKGEKSGQLDLCEDCYRIEKKMTR